MFSDIFAGYQTPSLTGDVASLANLEKRPISWWQGQLNFALWYATAGCGVSFDDHLQAEKHSLFASLYRFHIYYTTRRLLEELGVALSWDTSHSWFENPYNSRAYKRLCSEFGISPDTDWWQKLDHAWQGLGSWIPSLHHLGHIGVRMRQKALYFIQKRHQAQP